MQLHLPADLEPKEHAQHSTLIGKGGLGFYAAAELQLHPLYGMAIATGFPETGRTSAGCANYSALSTLYTSTLRNPMTPVGLPSAMFRGVSRYFGLLPKTTLRGLSPDSHDLTAPSRGSPNGEILAPTVRGVVYALHDLGMEFGKISYDSRGSHESIQILQSQGYEAKHLSVDISTQPYATLKEAICGGRLLCYYVPTLEEELLGLQYDAKPFSRWIWLFASAFAFSSIL